MNRRSEFEAIGDVRVYPVRAKNLDHVWVDKWRVYWDGLAGWQYTEDFEDEDEALAYANSKLSAECTRVIIG